jgi:hypothetical protein
MSSVSFPLYFFQPQNCAWCLIRLDADSHAKQRFGDDPFAMAPFWRGKPWTYSNMKRSDPILRIAAYTVGPARDSSVIFVVDKSVDLCIGRLRFVA